VFECRKVAPDKKGETFLQKGKEGVIKERAWNSHDTPTRLEKLGRPRVEVEKRKGRIRKTEKGKEKGDFQVATRPPRPMNAGDRLGGKKGNRKERKEKSHTSWKRARSILEPRSQGGMSNERDLLEKDG